MERIRVIGDDRTSLTTQNSSSGEDDISRGRSLQGSSINSNSSTSLADRMRGLRYDVQKRLSRFRSRSAERITNKSKRSSRSPPNRRMTTSSLPIADDFRSHKHTQQTRSGSHSGSKPPVPPPPITYNGPFIGTARALVDCTPSPYDIDALRFKRGDRVDIISMNPNGLWKGKCEGRIGNFKFINVEVLRPERKSFYVVPKSQSISNLNQSGKKVRHDSRESDQDSEEEDEEEDTVDGDDDAMGSSHNDTTISQSDSDIPKTVEGLLKRIGLEEHISVFILNGYEDLDNFMEMDDTELDYLGITNENHRQKIMSAVDLLLSRSETPSNSGGDSDVTLESSSPPPPPTSATTISIPRDSGVFNEPDSDESWSISSSYSTTPFKHHHHQVNATNLHGEDDLSLGITSLDINHRHHHIVKASLTTSRTLNFHLMSGNEDAYGNEDDDRDISTPPLSSSHR
uniref:SAM domain-containing protein n=1 Tax=Lepeophtheirus salmonis TaxID=72036 RepID=A0A0K2T5Q3_LEPSM